MKQEPLWQSNRTLEMIKLKSILESIDYPALERKTDNFRKQLLQQFGDAIETLYFHISSQRDVLHLDNIEIKKEFRGRGIGSQIMDQLKKFADENELIVRLSPEPEPRYKKKLDQFYKRHGFVYNRGRKKDYRLSSIYGPTMIRRPIKEEDVDDFELEELQGKDAILQYLDAHGKKGEVIDLGGEEYIIWDDNIVDPEYPIVKEKSDWIYGMEAMRLVSRLNDAAEDHFNKRFWEYPEVLFHGTPRENVENIRREGLKATHKSRGLSNRNIHRAVFTSTEPEGTVNSYGPVVVTIRTDLMKKDGFMPYATKEPNHTEAEVIDFIAGKIGAWEPGQHDLSNAYSEGTTEDTIIIYDSIPSKYLEITE